MDGYGCEEAIRDGVACRNLFIFLHNIHLTNLFQINTNFHENDKLCLCEINLKLIQFRNVWNIGGWGKCYQQWNMDSWNNRTNDTKWQIQCHWICSWVLKQSRISLSPPMSNLTCPLFSLLFTLPDVDNLMHFRSITDSLPVSQPNPI